MDGKLSKSGGTMTGDLNMGNRDITGIGSISTYGTSANTFTQEFEDIWSGGVSQYKQVKFRYGSPSELIAAKIGDPIIAEHAATKKYVDKKLLYTNIAVSVGSNIKSIIINDRTKTREWSVNIRTSNPVNVTFLRPLSYETYWDPGTESSAINIDNIITLGTDNSVYIGQVIINYTNYIVTSIYSKLIRNYSNGYTDLSNLINQTNIECIFKNS